MRNILLLVLLTSLFCLVPGSEPLAQVDPGSETQAVFERANHLNELLDKLLAQSNHSSIQKALHDGGEATDPLLEEAMRLKADGELFLAEGDYLQAAMTLQSALDQVFRVIRSDNEVSTSEDQASARLDDAFAANTTFISAADRVLSGGSNGTAIKYLSQAREARARADAKAANGDAEAALQELGSSTHLAQEAIMSVRNGMIIERGQ